MTHFTSCCSVIESLESRTLLALAAPDPTFGGDGSLTFPFQGSQSTFANGFDVQADGKAVVLGNIRGRDGTLQIFLARVNPNGSMDRTFGKNGRVITRIPGPQTQNDIIANPHTVRVQGDGKILVAGGLGDTWAVYRFNQNGTLDKSFDGDGIQSFSGVPGEGMFDIELLPGGKILVGGWAEPEPIGSTRSRDFGLARLNRNGSIDRSFGNNGFVHTDIGFNDRLMQLAIDSAGNIVVSGLTGSIPSVVLARYKSDGALDASFGSGGKVTTSLEGNDASPSSLHILPDNTILLSGSDNGNAFVMHLNTNGALDQTFANQGVLTFDEGSANDRAVIVRADSQRIAVLGIAHTGFSSEVPATDSRHFLRHFRANGSVDSTTPVREFSIKSSAIHHLIGGMRLVGKNRLVGVFNSTTPDNHGDIALARFTTNGALDRRFAKRGVVTLDDTGPLMATPLEVLALRDRKSLVLAELETNGRSQWVLMRLKADGKLDRSFGRRGQITLKRNEFFTDYETIALDSAGKIILAGSTPNTVATTVQRLSANGRPDNSFGTASRLVLQEMPENPTHIVALPGQKLLVAGETQSGIGATIVSITRINANGSVDSSFSQSGTVSIDFDDHDSINELLVHRDGSITAIGVTSHFNFPSTPPPHPAPQLFVVRYNPSGALDTSFSQDGRLLLDNPNSSLDARLLGAGGVALVSRGAGERGFQVVWLKTDGSLDRTFARQAPAKLEDAFFEDDGRIILRTTQSTVRVAADGSSIPSSRSGRPIRHIRVIDDIQYFSRTAITSDDKLLVAFVDRDGDLTVSRYQLD
jgi:uncharacterized delta-60 repeat protein